MFCPSCGAEYAIGLNYCNRCGANLSAPGSQAELAPIRITKPTIVISLAVLLLTLLGFTSLIEGAAKLAPSFQQNDPIVATIVLGMATIMVGDIMLIRLLSRLINVALNRPAPQQHLQPGNKVNQLPAPAPAAFVPVGSVTDHTTRTLDAAYRQPAQKNES
jgi:hypothetical protein